MTGGCPHCGAPYWKTVSADEDTLGELALPTEEYAAVCYNVRAHTETYLGFTLYFHPEVVYAVETRPESDEEGERGMGGDRADAGGESANESWSREDVYASLATARSRRDRLERGSGEARIRDLPLAHARIPPEDRPREPRP